MNHVTLVRGPSVTQRYSLATDVSAVGAPPLGLAYLAATLEQAGYQVSGVDAVGEALDRVTPIDGQPLSIHGLSIGEVISRIPASTDFIGVSCMFSTEWIVYRDLINAICRVFPNTPVVLGGEHATADFEYVMECCPSLLACALGEGEETILALLEALKSGGDLSAIPGLAVRDAASGAIIRTPDRKRTRHLDSIPWPQWDPFPLEAYLQSGLGYGITRGRPMPMLASRGCPYKCTFCSNPGMWGKLWNTRSPEDVVAEMKHYIERYQVTHITFWDLTMIVKREWIVQFLRLLIEEDLGIEWSMPSGTRSEAFDAEVAELLLKAGCRKVSFAPESGSAKELRRIQKKVNLDHMVDSIRICAQAGLVTKAHLILGFPDSTVRDILATYWLLLRMSWAGLHDCPVYMFHPYPGSALHAEILRQGQLPPRGAEYDLFMAMSIYTNFGNVTSWNRNFSPGFLRFSALFGMLLLYGSQFLFRPWRLVKSLWRFVRNEHPETMLERLPNILFRRGQLARPSTRAFTTPATAEALEVTEASKS